MPRGHALGLTFQSPDADRYSYSASYLRGRIAGMLAGRAAKELVCCDVTTGAENDLEQATGIAKPLPTSAHCPGLQHPAATEQPEQMTATVSLHSRPEMV